MKIKSALLAHLLMISAYYSLPAIAGPAEVCFQSPTDYEVYTVFGNNTPWNRFSDHSLYPYPNFNPGVEVMKKTERMVKNGPAKWKKITLKHTATQANGVVTFDSTGSTTPSGEIKYGWWSEDGGFRYEKIKYPHPIGKGKPGESITLRQMVDDPVCELHAEERVTFTFQ